LFLSSKKAKQDFSSFLGGNVDGPLSHIGLEVLSITKIEAFLYFFLNSFFPLGAAHKGRRGHFKCLRRLLGERKSWKAAHPSLNCAKTFIVALSLSLFR
jgi:hypothetical protein